MTSKPQTRMTARQIATDNPDFPTFYDEFLNVRDRLAFLDEIGDYDVLYEYDPTGERIVKEYVYNNGSPRLLLKVTEFTYNPSGTINTETVEKNKRKVLKQFNYDAAGNLISVRVRHIK